VICAQNYIKGFLKIHSVFEFLEIFGNDSAVLVKIYYSEFSD